MGSLQGFIFDLDGVLVDTAEYHYLGWQRLANEEGLPFDRKANEALRGISRRESLLLILKGRPVSEAKIQELMDRKNRYYVEYIQQITPGDMLPGALDLLIEIRLAGLKCAIGSASKNTCTVVAKLGIHHLVDAISDGYSVTHPKPAPDLFLHAARQLGLQPALCVVVEDAAAGAEAAIVGGFHSMGLGPRERVGAAEVVYPSLAGLHLTRILTDLNSSS
jgi:kojibiose phosphorylase